MYMYLIISLIIVLIIIIFIDKLLLNNIIENFNILTEEEETYQETQEEETYQEIQEEETHQETEKEETHQETEEETHKKPKKKTHKKSKKKTYQKTEEETHDNKIIYSCVSNQNYNDLCKSNNHPTYGVYSINKCINDLSKYTVVCKNNYINGNHYPPNKNEIITPCVLNNSDFNDTCKYYNTTNVPKGNSKNGFGAKNILTGKNGDCYNNDGTPNNNKSRIICNYNNSYGIPNIKKTYNNINYNDFTDCLISNTNFTSKCKDIINDNNAMAVEIMGYDCNPNYLRAKCITKNNYNNNINMNYKS